MSWIRTAIQCGIASLNESVVDRRSWRGLGVLLEGTKNASSISGPGRADPEEEGGRESSRRINWRAATYAPTFNLKRDNDAKMDLGIFRGTHLQTSPNAQRCRCTVKIPKAHLSLQHWTTSSWTLIAPLCEVDLFIILGDWNHGFLGIDVLSHCLFERGYPQLQVMGCVKWCPVPSSAIKMDEMKIHKSSRSIHISTHFPVFVPVISQLFQPTNAPALTACPGLPPTTWSWIAEGLLFFYTCSSPHEMVILPFLGMNWVTRLWPVPKLDQLTFNPDLLRANAWEAGMIRLQLTSQLTTRFEWIWMNHDDSSSINMAHSLLHLTATVFTTCTGIVLLVWFISKT